jgi:hypothetical protein
MHIYKPLTVYVVLSVRGDSTFEDELVFDQSVACTSEDAYEGYRIASYVMLNNCFGHFLL